MTRLRYSGVSILAVAVVGCARLPSVSHYHENIPRTVVVLPPINETGDIQASDRFLSTVTKPLAEHGYYVVPIAVVDRMMKANGLPTPGDMHTASIAKLREIFGADAVLYIRITRWGAVLGGAALEASYRLVDTRSGESIWTRAHGGTESHAHGGGGSLAGALVAAAVGTAVGAAVGPSRELVGKVNTEAFSDSGKRLLKGPRHPQFAREQDAAERQSAASRE